MTDPTPLAGLLLGLASTTHCIAMCGGVASALDHGAAPGLGRRVLTHGGYAVGRLSTYALIGALAGGLGGTVVDLVGPERAPVLARGARWAVGALLLGFALALLGVAPLARLERLGVPVWRRLRGVVPRLRAAPPLVSALSLGALWGFLPCGMVYGAAAVAALTGSAPAGALFMAAFGLGTVPAVLGVGAFAGSLWRRLSGRSLRRVTAGALALCGLWVWVGPLLVRGASHAHH